MLTPRNSEKTKLWCAESGVSKIIQGEIDKEINNAAQEVRKARESYNTVSTALQFYRDNLKRIEKKALDAEVKLIDTVAQTDRFFASGEGNYMKFLAQFNELIKTSNGELLHSIVAGISKINESIVMQNGKIVFNGDLQVSKSIALMDEGSDQPLIEITKHKDKESDKLVGIIKIAGSEDSEKAAVEISYGNFGGYLLIQSDGPNGYLQLVSQPGNNIIALQPGPGVPKKYVRFGPKP